MNNFTADDKFVGVCVRLLPSVAEVIGARRPRRRQSLLEKIRILLIRSIIGLTCSSSPLARRTSLGHTALSRLVLSIYISVGLLPTVAVPSGNNRWLLVVDGGRMKRGQLP